MKMHNFSAGPAILPASVIKETAEGIMNINGTGLSILEISHRSPTFVAILEEAQALVRELLGLGDEFEVLFLTGGASSQFFMVPANILASNKKAAYVNTGAWSTKSIKEAKMYGEVAELATSKDGNFNYVPKDYDVPSDLSYLHLTSNNTIFGTQLKDWPETDVPLVVDMSSDIFSRRLPMERFGVIYAGAQKNMGPAGVTLVIIRKDLLGKVDRDLPTMLNYNTHIAKGSSFNTPPVLPIYVSMLTLRWVKAQGGLVAMEQHNAAKAQLLYDEIDRNPMFAGTVAQTEDRSLMNVTFVLQEKYAALEKDFLTACAAAGCDGIKGHRSVGGFRASIYNSMPKSSVQALVDVMQAFEIKNNK